MMKIKQLTRITQSFAFIALVTTSCGERKKTNSIPKDTDLIPVKVMALSQLESPRFITASGQLTTDNETVLSFKTGGIVDAVLVKEGDLVKKGQLLAKLNLTEINALVAQAHQAHDKAQRDYTRTASLYKDSVATQEQMENAATGLSISKEQLDAATFNRAFSEIHAPANGYVLHKHINAGQIVAPGTPALITNDAVQGKWIFKGSVSDKQWAVIKPFDKAELYIDAFPGKSLKARVIRKSERSDPQTGVFTIELEVESHDLKLATGMFATAEIRSGQATSFWSIPYESVLDANGNEGFVFITNDNKMATRQTVTIESFNGNTIRVTRGLENAKVLIVSGSAYLTDGSLLEIIK